MVEPHDDALVHTGALTLKLENVVAPLLLSLDSLILLLVSTCRLTGYVPALPGVVSVQLTFVFEPAFGAFDALTVQEFDPTASRLLYDPDTLPLPWLRTEPVSVSDMFVQIFTGGTVTPLGMRSGSGHAPVEAEALAVGPQPEPLHAANVAE